MNLKNYQVEFRDPNGTSYLFDNVQVPRVGETVTIFKEGDDGEVDYEGIVVAIEWSFALSASDHTATVILRDIPSEAGEGRFH